MCVAVDRTRQVWIDDCDCWRQIRLRQMVIRDDHVNPTRIRMPDSITRPDSAIGGDNDTCACFMRGIHMLFAEAIPIQQPVWHAPACLPARNLDGVHQDCRRHDAVHVVIAKHMNSLPPLNRADGSAYGLVHVREISRVEDVIPARR